MQTPKGLRTHIGLYGRRNTGKSTLLNALSGQQVSIVSDTPGTTTDPVEKVMEFLPVGPVVFLDTAGIDDEGDLGALRRARSLELLDRTDLALIVTDGVWGDFEKALWQAMQERSIPCACVRTKSELGPLPEALRNLGMPVVEASALHGDTAAVREVIIRLAAAAEEAQPRLIGDLVEPGNLVLLVTPIDTGAPKGRLILPQVQAIRDTLDARCLCMVVTEGELAAALERVTPDIVVCDSQVVQEVVARTPASIPVTTFSILMARMKGDLIALARGAAAINRLRPGDRVLVAEACSHHPQADDIGRIKIPRWLARKVGGPLHIEVAPGRDLHAGLEGYALMLHCGGCTLTRRAMLNRLRLAEQAGLPVANYGIAISCLQGVLERSLALFPEALKAYREGALL